MPRPPERIELDDVVLRAFHVEDAVELARAVADSLDHLRPWMAWADNGSADPAFQHERLKGTVRQWARGEEYQYGLFDPDESRVLGSFGLMTRRGRGSLELGYWVRVDACRRGYATRASAVLTDVALAVPRVKRVLIYCDTANEASAKIPRKLGYTLLRVEDTPATAPGESGRHMVWQRTTPLADS